MQVVSLVWMLSALSMSQPLRHWLMVSTKQLATALLLFTISVVVLLISRLLRSPMLMVKSSLKYWLLTATHSSAVKTSICV
jgi:hypothetical protein